MTRSVPWALPRPAALVLLLAGLMLLSACRQATTTDYQLHTVKTGTLELLISETGELGSAREIWVNAPFAGTLSQLIPEGSVVKQGQVIGRLETSKQALERNSARLSLSEAGLDLKLAGLDGDRRLRESRSRQQTAALDLQIESTRARALQSERDTVAITRVRESLKALARRMEILELEARERARLYGLGYLSREERDQAQLQLAEAQKERSQLEAELRVLQAGPRGSELERQRLAVQRARDEQRRVGAEQRVQQRVTEVQQRSAKSRIDKYRQREGYYDKLVSSGVLSSPVAGTLVYGKLEVGEEEVPIKSGDAVQQGVQIAQLVDLARPVLRLMIHEIDAPRIKTGMAARLRFDAWPERSYAGKVTRMLPVARQPREDDRQQVRQFACEIALLETDARLRPGLTAQAEIVTARLPQSLLVPTQALLSLGSQVNQFSQGSQSDPNGQSTCQVLVDGKAVRRRVVTGPSDARMTVIRSGLKAGDQVILNPTAGTVPGPGTDPTDGGAS